MRRSLPRQGGSDNMWNPFTHGAALVVRDTPLGNGLAEGESIRGVVIEGHTLQHLAGESVFMGGARGVTAAADALLRRYGPAIVVERSSEMVVTNNTVSDSRFGRGE